MKKIRLGSWFFATLVLAIGAVGQTAPSNVGVPSTALSPDLLNVGFDPPLNAQMPLDLTFDGRSEEHTSELQSHLNLVCRLLLEKKKTSYRDHDCECREAIEHLQLKCFIPSLLPNKPNYKSHSIGTHCIRITPLPEITHLRTQTL